MERLAEFFKGLFISLGAILIIGIVSLPFFACVCFLCDWSLAEQLRGFAKENIFQASVLNNTIYFVAGIVVATLWIKFSNLAKGRIREVRDAYFYLPEEVKKIATCLLVVFSVGAVVSWRLDKVGLRLLPDGSFWWSWSSFANILASQLIGVIALLVSLFVVECFKKMKWKR